EPSPGSARPTPLLRPSAQNRNGRTRTAPRPQCGSGVFPLSSVPRARLPDSADPPATSDLFPEPRLLPRQTSAPTYLRAGASPSPADVLPTAVAGRIASPEKTPSSQ